MPLVAGLVLATAGAAGADIGVIVHEPVSALGFFTRVGHAGTCPPTSAPTAARSRGVSVGPEKERRILAGDPRLAALVLAAVIDYHLHQPEPRREDIEYVDGLFTLLRQASSAIERDAR